MIRTVKRRAAGVLLHPSSLAGSFAVGDLGPAARTFLDWLENTGLGVWQVLPLGPRGPGDSPYSSPSAFAGDTTLISPEGLIEDRLLDPEDLNRSESVDEGMTTLRDVGEWKNSLAAIASTRLRGALQDQFEDFRHGAGKPGWLDDWTLFRSLKSKFGEAPWYDWPMDVRQRQAEVLAAARVELAEAIDREAFAQFLFLRQWRRLREDANRRGIVLFGDLPIYASLDSADVWSRRDIFRVDASGRPLAVAGVPPDYFSEDGQLWGHPLYDWQRLRDADFDWWVDRIRWQLSLCDVLRIDHFRGLVSFWEVPGGAKTAKEGRWVEGPGADLFAALENACGSLSLVAEDLGVESPEVDSLRRQLGLPGMKVLQFAFDETDSTHLPHHFERETVVYTGTHDNATSRGWFDGCSDDTQERFLQYAGATPEHVHRDLIRLAWTSVARWAVAPMQDVLGLGSEARMNTPGRATGNWLWRMESQPRSSPRLARLTRLAGRTATGAGPGQDPPDAP